MKFFLQPSPIFGGGVFISMQNAGFSLIEVLVSLLIFSVGALSLAGFMTNQHQSDTRVNAGHTGRAALENLAELILAYPDSIPDLIPITGSLTRCANISCTSDGSAQYELQGWARHVRGRLPRATVYLGGQGNNRVLLTIIPEDGAAAETMVVAAPL